MRQNLQKSSRIRKKNSNKDSKCKLPKLVILQFNGTHIDDFIFWNQFETQIDKSGLSSVTKLLNLKKVVISKEWLLIDGLPWNTRNIAKNILSSKFWKPNELPGPHIQSILSLQSIAGTNPVLINEFYERLMTNAIDTMEKLKETTECIQTTIDKPPGKSR